MTIDELKAMTVLQLRKAAKEFHVDLGAGIDKAGMIEKIYAAVQETEEIAEPSVPEETLPEAEAIPDGGSEEAAAEAPAEKAEEPSAEPKYQAAWHNTAPPRYSPRPAYQAPGRARLLPAVS